MTDVASIHAALAAMGLDRFLSAAGVRHIERHGQQRRVPCPVHGGKDANCSVASTDGRIVFHCKSRGCEGDALHFVAAARGLDVRADFREVLTEAAALAGVDLDSTRGPTRREAQPVVEDPAVIAERRRQAEGRERILSALLEVCPLEGEGLRYLTEERGLSVETLKAARIGYVADPARVVRILTNGFPVDVLDELGIVYRGEHLAFGRHPLLFPVLRHGRPAYVQGRSLDPAMTGKDRWRSMRGGVPFPFGLDTLDIPDHAGRVYLCEGPIDTLSVLDMRIGAAVGVIGAGNFRPEWAEMLRGRVVMLAFDGDAAGDEGARKVAAMLHQAGARSVRRLRMPEGVKDVNQWMNAERNG